MHPLPQLWINNRLFVMDALTIIQRLDHSAIVTPDESAVLYGLIATVERCLAAAVEFVDISYHHYQIYYCLNASNIIGLEATEALEPSISWSSPW